MPKRQFTIAVSGLFVLFLLAYVAFWYAADRGIAKSVAQSVLPAFLLEIILYFLSGTKAVHDWLKRLRPVHVAILLTALAPVSWLLLAWGTGAFGISGIFVLLMAATAAFWYVLLPHRLPSDLAFLVLMAAPVLLKSFDALYLSPVERLPASILGLLMWYRTGLIVVLVIRRMEGIGFGFLPHKNEWMIGLRNFLLLMPFALIIGLGLGFAQLRLVSWNGRTMLLAILTFLGVLLVLSVVEEFFFRGLLQQQLSRLFGSNLGGLVVASLIFGSAHLPAGQFPNWRFALLAAIAGVFYGRAYQQAGSIRASMVTHSLVVTSWKVFFV